MPPSIAHRYRRFAREEARGNSPLYEALAEGVADDPELLARLDELPPAKQQPNLLLAAARHINGVPEHWEAFRSETLAHWDAVRSTILARSTQTNEPGRCAALVSVLARLPQPLALLEVGAAAGLCLLPDRYAYSYGSHFLGPGPMGSDTPVFPCSADASAPLPERLPHIVWRAGLDLNPLDVNDAGQMEWLETLVWPEQTERLERLRAAVGIARKEPPRILQGDLTRDLSVLVEQAPRDATLVVFHTAVLGYVPDQAQRDAFAGEALSCCDYWLSNEAPEVFPSFAPADGPEPRSMRFVLAVNARPVARTTPHGTRLDWISEPPPPNLRR